MSERDSSPKLLAGKGDFPRPLQITRDEWDKQYNKAFKKGDEDGRQSKTDKQ